jgi:hypothetical protein
MAFEELGIDKEKIGALKRVGAIEINPPWVCVIPNKFPMHYSAEYLRDTPLEKLKVTAPISDLANVWVIDKYGNLLPYKI